MIKWRKMELKRYGNMRVWWMAEKLRLADLMCSDGEESMLWTWGWWIVGVVCFNFVLVLLRIRENYFNFTLYLTWCEFHSFVNIFNQSVFKSVNWTLCMSCQYWLCLCLISREWIVLLRCEKSSHPTREHLANVRWSVQKVLLWSRNTSQEWLTEEGLERE